MMFGYGGGSAVLMAIGMLVFIGLVIWATYALVANGSRRGYGVGSSFPSPNAREVLDGRLARGEIKPDEYRHLVDTMSAGDR